MLRFQRRQRTTFSKRQLDALQDAFRQTHYPEAQYREHLAKVTQLDPTRIQVWFQNQRAKDRKRRGATNQAVWSVQGNPLPQTDQDINDEPLDDHPTRSITSTSIQSPSSTSGSINSDASHIQICLFSSSMANEAAKAVEDGKFRSIIEYHREKFSKTPTHANYLHQQQSGSTMLRVDIKSSNHINQTSSLGTPQTINSSDSGTNVIPNNSKQFDCIYPWF